jgi:hypothetical protein
MGGEAGVGLETDEVGTQHSVKDFSAACELGSVFCFGREEAEKEGWVEGEKDEEGEVKGDVYGKPPNSGKAPG